MKSTNLFLAAAAMITIVAIGLLVFDMRPSAPEASKQASHSVPRSSPHPSSEEPRPFDRQRTLSVNARNRGDSDQLANSERSERIPATEIPARSLVDLPPDPTRTVESEHREYLTILKNSGAARETWMDTARAVLESLRTIDGAVIGDVECFQAGCVTDVWMAAGGDDPEEQMLGLMSKWKGNHVLTGERLSEGRSVRTAIIVRPLTAGL